MQLNATERATLASAVARLRRVLPRNGDILLLCDFTEAALSAAAHGEISVSRDTMPMSPDNGDLSRERPVMSRDSADHAAICAICDARSALYSARQRKRRIKPVDFSKPAA